MGLCKTSDPRCWAIFYPRAIIWTTLVEVHQMKLHTKYQRSGPSGFRKEDFLSFQLKNLSLAPVTKMCNGPEPFEQLREDQPRIVPQNPISGLGGDVFWKNCLWTHGHRAAQTDARRTKCDHKSLPCHYVTGELNTRLCKSPCCMLSCTLTT